MVDAKRTLTAAFVKNVRHSGHYGPDKYGDQHGLILRVLPSGSKQWIWRGTVRGKRCDIGLGGFPYVTLAEARQAAFDNRKLARAGGDPLALKRRTTIPTLEQAALTVIANYTPSWRSPKTAALWETSLRSFVFPRLSHKRIDTISTADVMAVLVPIWSTKPATARKIRQRISTIMKWGIAEGHIDRDPAGEALKAALPKNGGTKHHLPALKHSQVTDALKAVKASNAAMSTKFAIEFLTLTASRSAEVRGARWGEFDLNSREWRIPAERMKNAREHRVPLAPRALEILNEVQGLENNTGLVFPSITGRQLSDNTLSKLFRELGVEGTPHGMRTAFRNWGSEMTSHSRETLEQALAHVVVGVEGAYFRSDLFERRRKLMDDWARYIEGGRHG